MNIFNSNHISSSQATPTTQLHRSNHDNTTVENPPELLSGPEMIMELGSRVLGTENIERWKDEGLEIGSEAYTKAFEALNDALKWGKSQGNTASTSYSFNAHDIVSSTQNVPAWFEAERQQELEQHPHPGVKEAFSSGALWYGHIHSIQA